MNTPLLIDTDVCIDFLRKRPEALAYLEPLTDEPWMSAITLAELYTGVRDGPEMDELDAFVTVFRLIPVDHAIARAAGHIRRAYRRSHGLGIADVLIAATAEVLGATLVTLNRKHFPMLSRLTVPYTKAG